MSFDLTNKFISSTFQNLLQKTGSDSRLYDLEGNAITTLTVGSLLPSGKLDTLGNPKQRWGKLYMASTIDVSGSTLTISSPSASAAGEDFGVSITGSLTVSGSATFTVQGPSEFTGSMKGTGNATFDGVIVAATASIDNVTATKFLPKSTKRFY